MADRQKWVIGDLATGATATLEIAFPDVTRELVTSATLFDDDAAVSATLRPATPPDLEPTLTASMTELRTPGIYPGLLTGSVGALPCSPREAEIEVRTVRGDPAEFSVRPSLWALGPTSTATSQAFDVEATGPGRHELRLVVGGESSPITVEIDDRSVPPVDDSSEAEMGAERFMIAGIAG